MKTRCPINVTVITETEKGLQFGKIVSYINNENIKNVEELKVYFEFQLKKIMKNI